jgi:O-antigen/teichoic acid export membrane protein
MFGKWIWQALPGDPTVREPKKTIKKELAYGKQLFLAGLGSRIPGNFPPMILGYAVTTVLFENFF